jgi:hypothetical protein
VTPSLAQNRGIERSPQAFSKKKFTDTLPGDFVGNARHPRVLRFAALVRVPKNSRYF